MDVVTEGRGAARARRVGAFLALVVAVVSLSALSALLWGGKPETIEVPKSLIVDVSAPLRELGVTYNVSERQLVKLFQIDEVNLTRSLQDLGISASRAESLLIKAIAVQQEDASKNWMKIRLKFALWFLALIVMFVLLRRGLVKRTSRWVAYAGAVLVFGVILGSDPSPMGTIKDAIVLFGSTKAVFFPRLIALGLFLTGVVVANKFICSWGCQFGVLQDLIFRINRNPKDTKGMLPQFKVPFVILNSVRVAFFVLLTVVALIWAFDVVELIDPFKIYKPRMISLLGAVFLGIILVASVFIYRPWCTLFCPFGLVGWGFEKLSWFKIKVDYDRCIACEACAKACPSDVMDAILKRERIIPDCFSCGNCVEVCPAKAISFSGGARSRPAPGKFRNSDTRA